MQKRGPTDIQVRTEQRQQAELAKLQAQETQRTQAAQRRTRGRASLISGSERGVGDVGFMEKNVATRERLGVEAMESSNIRSTAEAKRRQSLLDAQAKKEGQMIQRQKHRTLLDPAWGVATGFGLKGPS